MIGLMDCNNFFVSCERLFRPDLLKRPVIVLSSNDGCVVSRSQEVKDMGISMGMPYFQIKDLCRARDITVFSSNFSLYRDISERVMLVIKREFVTYEIYSIDEAFFTIEAETSIDDLYEIRTRIMRETGIPVSLGIGETKTLAKIASKEAKSGSGVCRLTLDAFTVLSQSLSCGSVWGIGRTLTKRLSAERIVTVADLLACDPAYIARNLGVVGERICMELRGTMVYNVGTHNPEEQASYTSTRSFGKETHDKFVVMQSLSYHVIRVAETLRKKKCLCQTLTVIAGGSRMGPFSHKVHSWVVQLTSPTNDTLTLLSETRKALDCLYDIEIPYKKAGVIASGIIREECETPTLFKDAKSIETHRVVNEVVDSINTTHGASTVVPASALGSGKWREQKGMLSREYTTQWTEIPIVKAI